MSRVTKETPEADLKMAGNVDLSQKKAGEAEKFSGRNRLFDLYFVTGFLAGLSQITRFWTNRLPAALPVIKSRVNN